jgi:prenyltransferase beta subunit
MRTSKWTGMALVTSLVVVAMTCLWTPTSAAAQTSTDSAERLRATDKALRWLDSQQNADGGFGEGGSDPQITCEVVLAFASAYEEPATIKESGNSPLDYLSTQAVSYTSTAEGTSRLILAVVAGNEDPRDFKGTNLVTTIKDYRDSFGQYSGDPSDGIAAQALAMLALQASKEPVPPNAVVWLLSQQNTDGGWGPEPAQASDTTSTALSLQALVSAGESPASTAVLDALEYLKDRQTANAGFASSAAESESDPVSTAQAIQALLAAGEDLFSSQWLRCLRSPFDTLLDAQSGDGSFESDVQATAASIPGLMGRTLPLPGRRLAALKGLEWLATQQQNDGGFGNGGFTADAVYAIALTGQDPDGHDWTKNGTSALDALEAETPGYIASAPDGEPAGELSKVIRAVQQAGGDPGNFAGMDLIDELGALYNSGTDQYHPFKVYSHDLALVAIHAVGETIPSEAVSVLESAQLDAGGWSWGWGLTSADVDSTGLSMQAIIAGGGPSSPGIIDDAADFLESLRFSNGGYPDLATRPEPNCDSTSLAIQGLLASGRYRQEPLLFSVETGAVTSSWDALLAFQEPAGSFVASTSVPESCVLDPESCLLATVEAVHALASPLYPTYQPLAEGETTVAGIVHGRLTCGSGLGVVAPYSGDDDNDGSASLRYRAAGETSWSGWISMGKGPLQYAVLLDLAVGTEYEIEVSYADPDVVSGQETQSLSLYMGKACIPLAAINYSG